MVLDNEDRVRRDVAPGLDRMEVDHRNSLDHRAAQSSIVSMLLVEPAIGVAKRPCLAIEGVVVRTTDGRCDRKRELAHRRFPDPDGPTSGIGRPSKLNDSNAVRGSASPNSSRWRVSHANVLSLIS